MTIKKQNVLLCGLLLSVATVFAAGTQQTYEKENPKQEEQNKKKQKATETNNKKKIREDVNQNQASTEKSENQETSFDTESGYRPSPHSKM